jgi:hypothetical protein
MHQTCKKVRLSRETLRTLDDRRRPDGPIGTEPASIGVTMCCTASCRGPHGC